MTYKDVYAIIPARSGSKGLPNKNIKLLDGLPLIAYSINFAKKLGCERVICSTDSEEYAKIARECGAEVPFLRSDFAAADTAMEQDILNDLAVKFKDNNIPFPKIIVWLRPTFVFRDLDSIKECIDILIKKEEYTAARTVCESESRLYKLDESNLVPVFDDKGKSMIRRQDVGVSYKVFSTDVIRFDPDNISDDFLGRKVYGVVINKMCGLDIDDSEDFQIVESIIKYNKDMVDPYLFT